MKKTSRLPVKKTESPRFTLRIPITLDRDLHALGRVEKRKMAKMVRVCLATALADWRKTHPGQSPIKTATT